MNVRICLTSIQLQPTWICDDVVTGAETIDYFSVGKWNRLIVRTKLTNTCCFSWTLGQTNQAICICMSCFYFCLLFFWHFFFAFLFDNWKCRETRNRGSNNGLVSVMETQMLQLFTSRGPLMGIFNFWHFID